MLKVFGVSAVMTLALVAGQAQAQCTRTTDTGTIDPGVTDINNHGDDVTSTVTMPFAFPYAGGATSTIYVCSNGWVSFAPGSGTGYSNVCLGANIGAAAFNRVPGPVVFAHWDDLSTAGTGNGIFTSVTGAPGSRVFNIEWRAVNLGSTNRADFEVRLFEGTSRVEIIYGNLTNGGASATAGFQSTQGTFDEVSCNVGGVLQNGMRVVYQCPLTNPSAGLDVVGPVGNNTTVLARVSVIPANSPPSTGLTAVLDASGVGGPSNMTMYDDGTHGDAAPGDKIFSNLLTIGSGYADGQQLSLSATVSDAQGRTAPASATLKIENNLPATADPVDSPDPVTTISGVLSADDADMYRIHLCEPGQFSASTVGGTTMDTQLWLFNADGTGITMDDDDPTPGTTHLQSLLRATYTASLPPGDYYLAISQFDKDPRDANGAQIWVDTPGGSYRVEHQPDDVGAANPIASWDAGGGGGSYNIAVTGVSGQACNSCPGNQCGPSDFNGDGDVGTDQDIEAFFACLGGNCCATCFCQGADFNGDGDVGTDQDIEAYFRVLGGGTC